MAGLLKKLKPDKVPGENGIPNRVLQLLADIVGNQLVQIATACIRLGYCPTHFKSAVTVVLKKPHKNYTDAKLYRPISLLNTIGKVIETAVATRIKTILKNTSGLSKTQIKARKNRSTIAALKLLTKQVRTV